jgi:hypothetical protein
MDKAVSKYFAKIGKKGGRVVSKAKIEACRRNAKMPRKPVDGAK